MKTEDKVNTPSLSYERMRRRWTLLRDLLGGTLAMRDAGIRWLPQEPKEPPDVYAIRLGRAVLYNGYKTAIDDLCDRPFGKPLKFSEPLPDKLAPIEEDCTREGRKLSDFAKDVLKSGVVYGVVHILVDYPSVAPGSTLEDEKKLEARPYFCLITAPELIDARRDPVTQKLTQVRIARTVIEPVGNYGQKEVNKVWIYTVGAYEVWRQVDETDIWELETPSTPMTFPEIPLVTIYLTKTEDMTADPPMEDLAWLNLAHWQSSADQRNALRFARIGILTAAGFTTEEYDDGFVIGPGFVVKSINPQAKLTYTEHSGAAIKIGAEDLKNLEAQMEVLGLQPVIESRNDQTATGKTIDDTNAASSLKSWVISVNSGLTNACELAAQWAKVTLGDAFAVELFTDFGVSVRATTEVDALLKMRMANEISRETFLNEMKRRGVIGENIDIEAEVAAMEQVAIEEQQKLLDAMAEQTPVPQQ